MTGMSEMPTESPQDLDAQTATAQSSAPATSAARRKVTVEVDRKVGDNLRTLAQWQGISEQDLLVRALEQPPDIPGQRSVTVEVSEAAAARLAATAATMGVSEEQLMAEAIDHYNPPVRAGRFWPAIGIPGLLAAFPLVLMFASPSPGSAVAWTLFAVAMLACCIGAGYLISVVTYAEWTVIKYGIVGLVSAGACGALSVLTAFTYVYWLLSGLRPASFNLPLGRVDAIYFAIGTFTTAGTGRLVAQSSLAELLLCCQVVMGWGFVAILVALLVPRAQAARKRLTSGRIIIRTRSTG
jgi:hypothetical protein